MKHPLKNPLKINPFHLGVSRATGLAKGQYDAGAGLCFLIFLLPIFWAYEKDQRLGGFWLVGLVVSGMKHRTPKKISCIKHHIMYIYI